ncbi:MAG: ABC transporter permease subunit, partial [Phyllobacteriaceae bacterium]|nr:ABC transporter permease subunit [Phyllobacteriaceae bacterium]
MSGRRRLGPLATRLALIVGALLGALLLAAPALRSTETWITTDPEVTRRLLDLLADARRLKHDWERAQRGDARFALDTEIRVVGAKIAALEATTDPPRRSRGVDAWTALLPTWPAIGRDVALRIAETAAALAFALVVCIALARLAERPRRVALTLALAPLGLPPPLLAEAATRLAASLGLGPSPELLVVAEILAGAPFAIALIWTATRRIDPREVEAARDLGFSTAAMLRRVALPVLTPALALAAVVVFARLLDDFSLARLVGAVSPGDRFGEWLRHRLVAAVDFPGGAAGALLAALAGGTVAVFLFAVVAPRFTPAPRLAARRPIGPPPRPGRMLVALLPSALILAGLLAAAAG